jgi:hypothetical protein
MMNGDDRVASAHALRIEAHELTNAIIILSNILRKALREAQS